VLAVGCGGNSGTTFAPADATTAALDLRQPSVQQLQRFAPGGIDASTSSEPSEAAPLLCGGTRPSRLTTRSIVKVPNTLSEISVLRYEFSSPSAANGFFDAMRSQESLVQGGRCTVATAESGRFTAVSLFAIVGSRVADASGTTTFSGGAYSGAYQYNTLRYVQQDRVVYLMRLDKQHGYADNSFLDAIENTMNVRLGVKLRSGAHSLKPSEIRGVLQRGQYECCTFGQPPIGSIGSWAQSADVTCPEVVFSGTPYTIVFANQLPNVQPNGLIAFTGDGARSATIPWGAQVTVVVDTFGPAGSFGCRQAGKIASGSFMNALSIKIGQ